MQITIRLFASLREQIGARELQLQLPDGARISDLKTQLVTEYPAIEPVINTVVFAMEDEYVPFDEALHDGSDVAVIPPVSGGSSETELFRITHDCIDGQELARAVQRDEAGAVTLFAGVVRNHSEGKAVTHLEYEAHESMALRKLSEVGEETKQRFPEISAVGIWHRLGRLDVGETSLLVAVSAAHRRECIEACHWAVDRIKEVVPVWKKEYGPDGSSWVEGHAILPPGPSAHS